MKHPIENAPPTGPVEESKPRRTRTMSPAALAANRANAQKSTGTRTPAGKTRAASNNYRHGLYRVEGYSHFSSTYDYS